MSERRRLVWETYGELGIARERQVTTPEKVLAEMGAERVWWCEYPEFNDPDCMTGMSVPPRPAMAFLPRKHTRCGWVWVVKENSE